MPRMPALAQPAPPPLEQSLYALTIDELKWYGALLGEKLPMRKGELVGLLAAALTNRDRLRRLWSALVPRQQQVVAEVLHNYGGVYDEDVIEAKYPGTIAPSGPQPYPTFGYMFGSGRTKREVTGFDLIFLYSREVGHHIPPEVGALLRSFVPPPPPAKMRSDEEAPGPKPGVEFYVSEAEPAVFHDLAATLALIQAGKLSVSSSTRLPTLATLRQLRERLLAPDFFPPDENDRAEDSIRLLALVVLVQAARWAAPGDAKGSKLELTRRGQQVLAGSIGAEHVREAWDRWLKSDLLDELSRIRAIRGQQSRDARLTKLAERREKFAAALKHCPIGRWVDFDEFLRYIRGENLLPDIERSIPTALYIGSYPEYGWLGYNNVRYWDIVQGTYLRVLTWEYAATLGIVEIAYTRPEDSSHDYGDAYGLDEYEYLSRYDGLLGLRLTELGAYVLGLVDRYTPRAAAAQEREPVLKVLPNLDVVVTDPKRLMPNERSFLNRVAATQSENVYHLTREALLEAVENGVDPDQVCEFLAARSGIPGAEFPQTVRVFFTDLDQRIHAIKEGERVLMLESENSLLLTELAHHRQLRELVQLAQIGKRTVLLVPEGDEVAVRKQLKKLGYVPGKEK